MVELARILLLPDRPIKEAIAAIDATEAKIALVVDEAGRLCGTVTDGDIRRGILAGRRLEEPVSEIMNRKPARAEVGEGAAAVQARMRANRFRQMPVVDAEGRVVEVRLLSNFAGATLKDNIVVLMAGGMGSRLRPLTEETPKPLLAVGNQPILQTILESFVAHGFHRFRIALNYKADMVEAHFGDGSKWGVEVAYLRESRPLGTAGALTLLEERPSAPLVVMNGDILTKVNFEDLLHYHLDHRVAATLAVRQYEFQVPFGVVEADDHRLVRIAEKPTQEFLVSAGIYVLDPDALALLPDDERCDMPSLLSRLTEARREVAIFPIREYWIDIGQMDDFQRANGDFPTVFK